MDQTLVFWTIVGMAVATYLPRLLPTLFLSGKQLQPIISEWLRLVPPAVLAAMLVPSLIIREGEIYVGSDNLFFWVAFLAIGMAWKTKSLSVTVLFGMSLVALGRYMGWGS